jgi:hypothetical protein
MFITRAEKNPAQDAMPHYLVPAVDRLLLPGRKPEVHVKGPHRGRVSPSAAAGTPLESWRSLVRCSVVLALLAVPAGAAAQDFTAQISPNPATLTAGGASAR